METVCHDLTDIKLNYPLETIGPKEEMLFMDIETTGFTSKNSNLYMIGCAYFKENTWKTIQFFADEYTDEIDVLRDFFDFSKDYKYLIHFNGNNFDVPYLTAKAKSYELETPFDKFEGIDLYRRLAPYKTFLKLENCKQKTVENYLGIHREDKFTGGDLIGIYHSYVKSQDEKLRELLLLHNFEDIKGMIEILPSLAFSDLFSKKLNVTKVSANYYKDEAGNDRQEVLMVFDLPAPLLTPVSFIYDKCYFAGGGNQGLIKVPLYEEEMKYYYANYKDYYYLPMEDMALHKSVATFVDKDHREKAKPENCYTRQVAKYLPEWSDLIKPFFKRQYRSNEMFFELTDERRTDRELFSNYVSHILNHMAI